MSASTHFVFDAYGTLFDVHAAAARHKDAIGAGWERLTQTWRAKHLEYTWIHSQTGRGTDFWTLTERSLDYAIAVVGGVPGGVRDNLLAAYRRMEMFPEVADVLTALRARGAATAILSNGDPDMLADAVRAAGIGALIDDALSVRAAGVFKPDARVYRLVTDRFGCAPGAVSFQSSNRWDIAGAKAFGFRCVWVNRAGASDEYPDLPADVVTDDLRTLLERG